MNTTQVGVDVAKAVFEVALSDAPGTVRERHRLSRERFRRFFATREASDVLMEACGSAHYWGRELQAMGHHVVLLHTGDVARYRDGNKTDRADAKALLEAARNSAIDPVPVKSPNVSPTTTASATAASTMSENATSRRVFFSHWRLGARELAPERAALSTTGWLGSIGDFVDDRSRSPRIQTHSAILQARRSLERFGDGSREPLATGRIEFPRRDRDVERPFR